MHGTMPESVTYVTRRRVDWATEYDQHAAEILSYLTKLTDDREAARELMQDTFVRAIRSESSLRDPKALRAWLYRTATNLARNHHRRRALIRFLPFTGGEHSSREAFDPVRDQVRQALTAIGSDTAATLLLFYVHGFTRHELAEMHGVSEEAIKSRLARGRRDFMASYRRMERGLAR